MLELIGKCMSCSKNVYCDNGFFTGVHIDGKLLCNNCAQSEEKK